MVTTTCLINCHGWQVWQWYLNSCYLILDIYSCVCIHECTMHIYNLYKCCVASLHGNSYMFNLCGTVYKAIAACSKNSKQLLPSLRYLLMCLYSWMRHASIICMYAVWHCLHGSSSMIKLQLYGIACMAIAACLNDSQQLLSISRRLLMRMFMWLHHQCPWFVCMHATTVNNLPRWDIAVLQEFVQWYLGNSILSSIKELVPQEYNTIWISAYKHKVSQYLLLKTPCHCLWLT